MSKYNYKEIRERAWEANMGLVKYNLVKYTFGNVSAFDPEKAVFAIKPSGFPYEYLKPEDLVVVDLENKVVEGKNRYSSDTKTHSLLYRNFRGIGGVAHVHAPYSVAWAQAVKPIPVLGTTHADAASHDIPCTEIMSDEMIKGDYEEETGNQILETFRDISYKEVEMVLVACHGPFTWGETPEKALYNCVMVEEIAKMALLTLLINPSVSRLKNTLISKHYTRKHGKDAYYGQDN
ncbi:MAG TPA: L-ribulose-5-phosphate 4-epimerase AraD [Syntrophales bacterium]|nr:L-ribulose-5-phosphate 4-epimerase AraD [Syntrophales bacterium]